MSIRWTLSLLLRVAGRCLPSSTSLLFLRLLFLVPSLLLVFLFLFIFISFPFFVLPLADPPLSLTTLFTLSLPSRCITYLIMCFMYHLFFLLTLSSFLHHSFMSSSIDHSNLSHPMPYRTACLQYSHLTHIPPPFYLLFTRSLTLASRCPLLLAFLFLSGDIELNSGSVSFTLCTLNICSILHPLHSAALSDLIDAYNPDLFCLTETWIKPTTTSAELLSCTPPNYTLLSVPRNHSGNSACIGGGTGFLIREPFTQLPT